MTSTSTIAVSATSFAKQPDLVAQLQTLGVPIVVNAHGIDLEGKALIEFLHSSKADIAIVGRELITAAVIDGCPDLRCIAKYGVGIDNIDEAALAANNIRLYDAPGTNRRAVAELVLAFALGHVRNVIPALILMKEGRWIKNGGRDLSSLSVGIVGFGHTGSEVARLLQPFGCTIRFTDVLDKTEQAKIYGAIPSSYEDVLIQSDVITFHVPATSATKKMFGLPELKTVQPHALVINTSRGSVVDFDEACEAVFDQRLGGFAADVFPAEPFDVSSRSHPRLYFTPHIGGNSREAVLAMGHAAIGNVAAYLDGR